ncbi:hypothetical protein PG275_09085 [Riemerella anatipestifer]|nr:hypothetical protein [Riemerella anatipestifer]
MEQDYSNLKSYYIPNKIEYLLIFPLNVLFGYNGESDMDVTIDDELLFYILEPLIKNNIEYDYDIVEREWNIEENKFSIILTVNKEKFNPQIVIENLKINKMIKGLKLFKKEYNKLTEVFRDEK